MHSMPPLPEDYLPRICSKLELSPKVEGAARDLLRAAQDVPLTNSVPISLAAAAVYIAAPSTLGDSSNLEHILGR